MTTVTQYNNLAQLGKWILSFLGALIMIVGWGVFYGTSFVKDTGFSFRTLNTKIDSVKSGFTEYKTENNSKMNDINKKIEYLMNVNPNRIRIKWSTVTVDKNRNYILHDTK